MSESINQLWATLKESARQYAQLGRRLTFREARDLVIRLRDAQAFPEKMPSEVIDFFAREAMALNAEFLSQGSKAS